MYRISLNPVRGILTVGLATLAVCFALAAMPSVEAGPLAKAAPATADAATRHWWGVKFNWTETNRIADWPAFNAKQILRGGGLSAAVVATFYYSYREAARWSRWQGRCLGVTWIGSQVPGQRC